PASIGHGSGKAPLDGARPRHEEATGPVSKATGGRAGGGASPAGARTPPGSSAPRLGDHPPLTVLDHERALPALHVEATVALSHRAAVRSGNAVAATGKVGIFVPV